MDTLVGGPGLRRGRRNPETVEFGETLDFWRVVDLNRDRSLSLRAEMKLPGEAQLDFRIEPIDEQADQPLTRLVMTARYRPRGDVNGLASFTTMQTAINSLAGHYTNYPNRPLPDALKERLTKELNKAEISVARGA